MRCKFVAVVWVFEGGYGRVGEERVIVTGEVEDFVKMVGIEILFED